MSNKIKLSRFLGALIICTSIAFPGCGEMTGDSGGKITSAGSDISGGSPGSNTGSATGTDGATSTSSTAAAKLQIDMTPPKTPGQKDALLSTIYTDDGMKTTFWGTKDGTGLVTGVTQSQTWSDDPTKGFRVSYDTLNRPVQLYSMATGYSTRLIYGDKKITCLFYDNSGQYLGGNVLTLNDSTGEVTAAKVTEQTYSGALSGDNTGTMTISTVLPPGTAPVVAASKAYNAKRAGVIDALIKAPQYIDAFQRLWETDPDFKYDVLTFPIKNAGTILGTLAINTVGTSYAAKVLGITTEGLTLEALTNKYIISNKLWDAALSAGAKMNEAITSLKARIANGEDVEADGSLSSSVTTQPATVAYNSQTNWQTQNTPAPVIINNGSATQTTIPAVINNSNKISGSGTFSDGSTASISGDWSINDLISAGCSVSLLVFENGKSSISCITWADGTGNTGDTTTTTTGGDTTVFDGCYTFEETTTAGGYTGIGVYNIYVDKGKVDAAVRPVYYDDDNKLRWTYSISSNLTGDGNFSIKYTGTTPLICGSCRCVEEKVEGTYSGQIKKVGGFIGVGSGKSHVTFTDTYTNEKCGSALSNSGSNSWDGTFTLDHVNKYSCGR